MYIYLYIHKVFGIVYRDVFLSNFEICRTDIENAVSSGQTFKTTHVIQVLKMFQKPDGVKMYVHDEDSVGETVSIVHALCH